MLVEVLLRIVAVLQTVTCGDEVDRGKPDPEIYFKTAKALKLSPRECLVVEDAPSGIEVRRPVACTLAIGCSMSQLSPLSHL